MILKSLFSAIIVTVVYQVHAQKTLLEDRREAFEMEFMDAFNSSDTSRLYSFLMTGEENIYVSEVHDPDNALRVRELLNDDSAIFYLRPYSWTCQGLEAEHMGYFQREDFNNMFTNINKYSLDRLTVLDSLLQTVKDSSKTDKLVSAVVGAYLNYRKYLERHTLIGDSIKRSIFLGTRVCDSKLLNTADDIRTFNDLKKDYKYFLAQLKRRVGENKLKAVNTLNTKYCDRENAGCYPLLEFDYDKGIVRCFSPIIYSNGRWKFFKCPDIR